MTPIDMGERLTAELRHRSDEMDGSALDLTQVRASARRIQRRRRLASGAVAAAVLAVAVPTALAVTGTTRAPSPTTPPPWVTDTRAPLPTPAPRADGTFPLTLRDLPRGEAPRVGYLLGTTAFFPQGGSLDLPHAYDSLTPQGDVYLGTRNRDGSYVVDRVDSLGQVLDSRPGSSRLAVSLDGHQTAYVDRQAPGEPTWLTMLPTSGSGIPRTIGVPADAAPVGFLSDESVVYRTEGERPQTWITEFTETRRVPGVLGATATSQGRGLLAVQTSWNDDGTSCWAVLSSALEQVTQSCRHAMGAFSPDGERLVGWPSDSDGLGPSSLSVLDADTGKAELTWSRSGRDDAFVGEAVWEDSEHVVASVYDDGTWQLVRFDLDGRAEAASDPVRDDADPPLSPFRFLPRP